jgi:hypothetical protein
MERRFTPHFQRELTAAKTLHRFRCSLGLLSGTKKAGTHRGTGQATETGNAPQGDSRQP